jgi:general stress protein YciG
MGTINDRDTASTENIPAANPKPPTTSSAALPIDEVPSLEAILACDEATEAPAPAKRRGFAAMDRAKVRELARRGAAASQAKGTAHRFTADEARAAGRKGGAAPHRVRGRGKRTAPRAAT